MLLCSKCETSYSGNSARWRCDCGAYLMLQEPGMFAAADLHGRPKSLWRYYETLGVSDCANVVSLGEGMTPLVRSSLDGASVLLKLDYLCPTGSYKDRGASVMISKLKEWGVRSIIEDSSGNAGASIAAYASLAGIHADIYIPESTSAGKAAQIAMYGAKLVKVSGTREDTARAAWNAAENGFYGSHNWSPYFLAGMKTVAYEIAEQLSWKTPDWVITPAGGGGLLVGLYLGFVDLVNAGIVSRIPRLVAVQSRNCDPIYEAWRSGNDDVSAVSKRPTAAEGISVAQPVRGKTILQAVRGSNGVVATVTDEVVWETVERLGKQGVYVEPTAAAAPGALADLRRRELVRSGDTTVIVLTGSGLKATDKIVEHYAATVSA